MIEDTPPPDDIDSYSSSKNVGFVVKGVSIFHILTGVLTIPLVYDIFTFRLFQALPINSLYQMLVGSILLITIPLYIILGIAIWLAQPWVWKASVIANILCLIFNIFGLVILTAILNHGTNIVNEASS